MSVVIGIEYFERTSEICIYNEKSDDYEYRKIESSDLEKITFDLKNEFRENLKKIFVLNLDDPLAKIDGDSKVCSLEEETLDFNRYLSTIPTLGDKILQFSYLWDSILRLSLYEIITLEGNIYKTKIVKWTEFPFHAEDFHEMLIQATDDNLQGTHAFISYEPNEKRLFLSENIMQEKNHFCSFTMDKSEWWISEFNGTIYGRFLLQDEKVQSLIKLEPDDVQCFSKLCSKNVDFYTKEQFSLSRPINNYKSQTKLMGIDLGASRCVVCVSRNKRAELVKIDQEYSMPSIISFAEEEPIIGTVAQRHLRTNPESVLFDFKYLVQTIRWRGDMDEVWPFGICQTEKSLAFFINSEGTRRKYSSTKIYQILLEKLKAAASEYQLDLNEEKAVNQAVITVPVLNQKQLIEDIRTAAELAGIQIIRIITETHADLLYFLSKYDISPGESAVIVDIGGGTAYIQKFVIDHDKKIINMEKHDLSELCGRDTDKLLMQKLHSLFECDEYDADNPEKSKMLAEVERIKRTLSFDEAVLPDLPTIIKMENPPQVTRTWFEQNVLKELLSKYKKEPIEDMHRNPTPSKVYLFGGTCQIPYFQNYFKSIFGEDKIVVPHNFQEITATGALTYGLQVLDGEIEPFFNFENFKNITKDDEKPFIQDNDGKTQELNVTENAAVKLLLPPK